MIEILKYFWKYIAITGGVLLVLFKARQSGKDAVKHENMVSTLNAVKQREKTSQFVDSSSDDERKRLRKKFNRD